MNKWTGISVLLATDSCTYMFMYVYIICNCGFVLCLLTQIGWRDRSLRMLLYMSNAGYHLAGDGKVHVLVGVLYSHQFLYTYMYI